MLRSLVCLGTVSLVWLTLPVTASAQVVGDAFSSGWRMSSPRFGFFQASRRQIAAPDEDQWQSRDPAMIGEPAFGSEMWGSGNWDSGSWGAVPWTVGCCEPLCEPCPECCDGISPDTTVPSAVAPGTPRALPIPMPVDPANPSPEYVPRNKVPMPVDTPDDPNWHKIPETPAPARKVTPEPPSPVELPMDIPIPAPVPDKDARRPLTPRTSSRFIPVPRPTAARVMSLQPELRR